MSVAEKTFGLLLVALAVQLMLGGLDCVGIVHPLKPSSEQRRVGLDQPPSVEGTSHDRARMERLGRRARRSQTLGRIGLQRAGGVVQACPGGRHEQGRELGAAERA